jgi:signal transduction histidine kinase
VRTPYQRTERDAGRSVPYEFRGRRLSDDEPRVVGIGRDVTDREERTRQLKVLAQWLRHNIRNELNVVRGLTEDLAAGRDDDVAEAADRIVSHIDHLVAQADRQRRVVELLTDPPDSVPVDAADLLAEEVERCRRGNPAASVDVVTPADVVVDALPDLRLAVRELLENAVTFAGDEPTVEATVLAADGHGVLRVRDDGPGIPDIEVEALGRTSDIDQLNHSAGLGLLFVYWVPRLSGGDVDVSTDGEDGSVVTLTLPLAAG